MGYGPLVRATTGVTSLWTSAEHTDSGARHPFYDATTVFPDHVVGRIVAIGALAGLIRRLRSGAGAHVHVSQAEAGVNQLDTRYVVFAAEALDADVSEGDTEHLLLRCAGDDEWCVVSVGSDTERRAIAGIAGDSSVAEWAAGLAPDEVARRLQAEGLAAGPMQRADDVLHDPQLRARHVLTEMAHPYFEVALPSESGPAVFRNIPPAPLRPAPLPGADTRQICRDVLGIDDAETERLIDAGVLFAHTRHEGVRP